MYHPVAWNPNISTRAERTRQGILTGWASRACCGTQSVMMPWGYCAIWPCISAGGFMKNAAAQLRTWGKYQYGTMLKSVGKTYKGYVALHDDVEDGP